MARSRSGRVDRWATAVLLTLLLLPSPIASAEDSSLEGCPVTNPPAPFTDRAEIPEVHRLNVDCVYNANITRGFADLSYRPGDSVRRDQMAAFVARTLDTASVPLPTPDDQGFSDIAGNTHSSDINRLAAARIVLGTSPTTFSPGELVRRDQIASFALRAVAFAEGRPLEELQSANDHFDDVEQGNVHRTNINGAVELGLAQGRTATTFDPSAPARRDQMASFLVRALSHLVGSGTPSADHPNQAASVSDSDTLGIRMEPAQGPTSEEGWISTRAPSFVKIPRMAASFVAPANGTNVAITFSAEAYTSHDDKRMAVRALIDGIAAEPHNIIFTEGPLVGARSFTFTATVDEGIHSVEMQWLVDRSARAFLRAASLQIRHGPSESEEGTLTVVTPDSGPNLTTRETVWKPVPGLEADFYVPEGANVVVKFSAEAVVLGSGHSMFVRALVDGEPLRPSDVVFTRSPLRHSRMMIFGDALQPGWHTASIEWLVSDGGQGVMGDRTLAISAYPPGSGLNHIFRSPPSGPSVSTNSATFEPIPGLAGLASAPPNAEFGVAFGAEVWAQAGARMWVRLRVGAEVVAEEEVVVSAGPEPGIQSFVFDRKHIFPGGPALYGVYLDWRAEGGTVFMGDRAMAIVVEPGRVPDLAEAPPIGSGNQRVEPAMGARKVLTILYDPKRPDHPAPSAAAVTDALWGSHGVRDYYEKVSGGRFTLTNAGVLGWHDAWKPAAHYWDDHPTCDDADSDGFTGGHQERWAEALMMADAAIDFSTFDTNRDGVLQPSELAILIVVPQTNVAGFVGELAPYCDGSPFVADGVIIPEIAEWFTSAPQANFSVAAHELAHLLLNLGDMYIDNFNATTEAAALSLMSFQSTTPTSHLDPVNKLALGWVTPDYLTTSGSYDIEDVKVSGRVAVLPRRLDGDGKEFFVLEVRRGSASHPLYDEGFQPADGIAVWHAVEGPSQNATAAPCMTQSDWDTKVSSNARRGIRLLRPGIAYTALTSSSLWTASSYDLLDTGLVCPGAGEARNVLAWADKAASGYRVTGWSGGGGLMSFHVHAP
jgi:M6 family metalloprotease-like protein